MYQFYYSFPEKKDTPDYKHQINEIFHVSAIRPTMWEEHCLECAAPQCFESCVQYMPRSDGRCKRFYNGIAIREENRGCCNQAARICFRPWGNMMTVLFPGMLTPEAYQSLTLRNQHLGNSLRFFNNTAPGTSFRWQVIRTVEYLRRRKLRRAAAFMPEPDALVFHGYSFEQDSFHLIIEIFRDNISVFRRSLKLQPGENLIVLNRQELSKACWQAGNLLKIYPENNLEAEIEILWCDFVQGDYVEIEKPADKVKCVVWDLDNTLWDGTLVEAEHPEDLSLRKGVKELICSLDERGIIQSIASKNDYESAWPLLEKMGISGYFLYPQIHWGAKSDSVRTIAENLNIGIDSIALLDDSDFERRQVLDALPCVRCFPETEISTLLTNPAFQVVVTEESRSRRSKYRAEEERNQIMQANNEDTLLFLKKCHLQIILFTPKTDQERLRCFELVNRTNQLNMSGRKYTQEGFDEMMARPECNNFAFSCEDDFGSYGIVGFGQYRTVEQRLKITEFAMSCRVAGKCIESALFSMLLKMECCSSGEMVVVKTEKNGLLRRTLEEIGFEKKSEDALQIGYSFALKMENSDVVKVNVQS